MKIYGGGFEPPSRDAWRKASTYIVVLLEFRVIEPRATGSRIGYFGEILHIRPERPSVPVCYLAPLPDSQTKSDRTGCQFRQPCATVSCQVKFSVGWLTRPTDILGMQPIDPSSGRNHSPPYLFINKSAILIHSYTIIQVRCSNTNRSSSQSN